MTGDLARDGWTRIGPDPQLLAWATAALPFAEAALEDPSKDHWYRCERTWFAGVDALPNDAHGRLGAGPDLPFDVLPGLLPVPLHEAQMSAVFPGYPKPLEGESEAAARYRLKRDAAHVDGILPIGADRRRFLKEPHAWILGLPLSTSDPAASPLVVWEGSHRLMSERFRTAFSGLSPEAWGDVDLTEIYQATRREAFDTCMRRTVSALPGEALLLDAKVLHGIAPWASDQETPRLMAYFRPVTDYASWLKLLQD